MNAKSKRETSENLQKLKILEDSRKKETFDKTKTSVKKEKAFIIILNSSSEIGSWYIDSYTSSYVTNQQNYLQNERKCKDASIYHNSK